MDVGNFPVAFEVADSVVARMVMGYLNELGLHDAIVSMQLATGIGCNELGPELLFLQELILSGHWEDVISYLLPLKRFLTRFDQVLQMNDYL